MKLKPIIKMLFPVVVGTILTIGVIIFVLMQLSAASFLMLLFCINVIVWWICIESNNDDAVKSNQDLSNDTKDLFDRMADAESEIREIKEHLKIDDDE